MITEERGISCSHKNNILGKKLEEHTILLPQIISHCTSQQCVFPKKLRQCLSPRDVRDVFSIKGLLIVAIIIDNLQEQNSRRWGECRTCVPTLIESCNLSML